MTEVFQAHSSAIECEGCAHSIQRSLSKMAGVQKVSIDVQSKRVTADYDPDLTNGAALRERLTQAGFLPD